MKIAGEATGKWCCTANAEKEDGCCDDDKVNADE